jgi:hypothetical protein
MTDTIIYLAHHTHRSSRSGTCHVTASEQNNIAKRTRDQARAKAAERELLKIGDHVFSTKHRRGGTVTDIDIDVNTRKFLRLHVDFVSFRATLRPGEFQKRFGGG